MVQIAANSKQSPTLSVQLIDRGVPCHALLERSYFPWRVKAECFLFLYSFSKPSNSSSSDTRVIHVIKDRQMPLLVPDLLLKHSNFRLPFSIVATSPWIGFSSRLGGLIPSIYVSACLKDIVLLVLTQLVPLILVIVAVFRGKCDTLVTTFIVSAWLCNAWWLHVVRARLFHKVLIQRNAPIKILTQAFIRHDAVLNRVKYCGIYALTKLPDLGHLVNAFIPMIH